MKAIAYTIEEAIKICETMGYLILHVFTDRVEILDRKMCPGFIAIVGGDK